ncbi:4918_t:CDS:2 [Funneliformis geosporum]|uniref:4918_t:CDS:1 n=1 Tax=Funneliformis geosporum TaxID=1117311 RepID=A0A9W4WLR8_9GLOM|nr:4918_t:CDS:2 [Funneliformis geosporum]
MEDKLYTFHVHLPIEIEKLGQPVVIGDGKELGNWKYPIVKLFRPSIKYPTYWKSQPLSLSNAKIRYNYAIHLPASFFQLEDEKVSFESIEKRSLSGKNQFDIWINHPKYTIDQNIVDYAFVDHLYDNVTIHNLGECASEFIKILSLHHDLTVSFSNYEYITKKMDENPQTGQRLFLCILLGHYIPSISGERIYKLPTKFQSEVLIEALAEYRRDILCLDANEYIVRAILSLIYHNATIALRLDWLVIFKIAKDIDPEFEFLENLQNVRYNDLELKNISKRIKPNINNIELENTIKITRWLVQLCQNIEILFEVWDIFLIRNKQISQYFIYRVQNIISNNHANDLMNNFSKIPSDFRDHISYMFRRRVLSLLKNLDRRWSDSDISALQRIFQQSDLNWNDEDVLSSLELISQSHNLELLTVFPEILNDWFLKSFTDIKETKLSTICHSWFNLLLYKLDVRHKSSSDESKYTFTIFQQLDRFYPLFAHRTIWKDLSTIALDKVKGYSESCILGATKSMIMVKEQEVKRLYIEIVKEILNKMVQQADDQLMKEIFMICDCKDESLEVPNTICEDILCQIMFYLSQLPVTNPSEQHLSILRSSKFWNIIFRATGSVAKLHANSYVRHIQISIAELDRILLDYSIDMQLLQEILEYSDEILLKHFSTANDEAINDKISTLRILYYNVYTNQIDLLSGFYQEFCSAPKVTDSNDFIKNIQKLEQNLRKVTLKQVLESEYWSFHEKTLDSANRCHKYIQSRTFRNIFEVCLQKDAAATNVEYIAQKLMPIVFENYKEMSEKFKSWEDVSYSEALLFWKDAKNFAEFKLKELSFLRRNDKFLQTLEQLWKLPQWIERLEQLEKTKKIFQTQQDGNDLISKSNRVLRDEVLVLCQVNEFVIKIEKAFYFDQSCWNFIKEISIAEDFLNFLKKISENDIKKLLMDDHSDERLIQEDTILSFLHVRQHIYPLINNHKIETVALLDDLQLMVEKNPTLVSQLALCNNNNMVLQEMYHKILNHDQIVIEKVKNAVFNGTYNFVFDEKIEKCIVMLNYHSSAKEVYNLDEMLGLRKQALLISNSNAIANINDFIELVDIIQNIIDLVTILIQRGHFKYRKFEKKIEKRDDMKEFLTILNDDLETWESTMNQAQNKWYYLTFFTAHHLWAFYDYFTSEKLDKENEEMCITLIRFVNNKTQLPLHGKIRIPEHEDLLELLCEIGNVLDKIFKNIPKESRKLEVIQKKEISNIVTNGKLFIGKFKERSLIPNAIISLYANNGYYPEPWQLLICTTSTTMEDITNFIKRSFLAANNEYSNHLFCIANLELLHFELQYGLVNYIEKMQLEHISGKYLLALLCCKELEVPNYILDQYSLEFKEIDLLAAETMKEIYKKMCPNIMCVSSDISGQGKTEWIKDASFSEQKVPYSFLINDSMDLRYLVNKLKECTIKHTQSLHINVLPFNCPEDVNIFLFELTTFRIVLYNKVMVSIPETSIYIEIDSSLSKVPPLSSLMYLSSKHLSWNIENFRVFQEISSPVQIVCHYLSLYDREEVDTEEITLKAIKYPLSAEYCRNLIIKYFLKTNEKRILSFRYIEIFVSVLADQLIRLSSSQYFTIDNLKLKLKDTTSIRSTILKSFIDVSKDFATKSIKMKASPLMINDESSFFETNSNINYVIAFPNFQASDFCTVLYHDKNKVPDNIKLLLESQVICDPEICDYNKMSTDALLMKLEGIARSSTQELNLPEYTLTSDNLIKMALILLRVRVNIPIVICGEAGCGKTSLITYLARLAEVQFQAINLHCGIDEETITSFVLDALKDAIKGEIWLLFDEINSCRHLGLLSDLISNRMFQGKPLHPNIRLFSTCHPFRLLTLAQKHKNYEEQSLLVYQVSPLPDKVLDYVLDYNILKPDDEYNYIKIMVERELKEMGHSLFTDLVFASQNFIRKVEEPYRVSLRDVKRAITLVKFFYNSLENRPAYKEGHVYPSFGSPTTITRCHVLSLSICYQSRLYDHDLRKHYRYEMGQIFQTHNIYVGENVFVRIVHEEQENYINRMRCPSNMAIHEALLENVLALIVCILTKIPIFIIGETGSSKSLAIHLINSNLRGSESNDEYFKKLPRVIEFVEASVKKPLKILHHLLEPSYPATGPAVSFIGLSNLCLNISKSSRAILVQTYVSPKFKCILVMDEKKSHLADPSLLNRFEKQKLSISDVLDVRQQSLVLQLKDWTKRMTTFEGHTKDQIPNEFSQKDLFVGFDEDVTLQSLVLNITKNNSDDDKGILEKCKDSLISTATSDGIIRAEKSIMEQDEIIMLKKDQRNDLFGEICH